MKNIDIKTIGGVAGGVALGYFALNIKNPFALIAIGVGGGFLANKFIKTRSELIAKADESSKERLALIQNDIKKTMVTNDAPTDTPESISFNPTVGYFTPHGTVEEDYPAQTMDINF